MDYRLIDTGNRNKLEQVGPYTLVRPAPQAIWAPRQPSSWSKADATYDRNSKGSGEWEWRRDVKREFDILFSDLAMRIRLTDFGHLGLFAEQADNWQWIRDTIRERLRVSSGNINVLNLFAYTGGSTLAASQAGAQVVHVDAAKGVVDWARENAQLSHLDNRPIRWIVDDAVKFVQREVRRGNKYHGIIMDPPSFGRGPKGQVFKIENQLPDLLDGCRELLARNALFCTVYGSYAWIHTAGHAESTGRNNRRSVGSLESGEMTLIDEQNRCLPSGAYARWTSAS